MEENSIEMVDPNLPLQLQAKEYFRFIRSIVNNPNKTLEDKLEYLSISLDRTKEEIKYIIEHLGMELTQSQFSAAKLHTLKQSERYIISSAQNASHVNVKFLNNI